MRSARLGKTGLEVSQLGFGGIPITRLDLAEAVELVKYSLDRGITFFDTAYVYGDSEAKMGAALQGLRDQVVLATKTLVRDAAGARAQLEESLRRLRTDYIDLYQLHNLSNDEAIDQALESGGAYEAAAQARDEGKIRHIGFTAHNLDIAEKACRSGLFTTIQVPFNLIEHDPAQTLLPLARENDMGIIAMKPFGGGLLQRAELCFGFLQQYDDIIPIPGLQTKQEVDENIRCYESPRALTKQDWEEIERTRSELGERFCHRCEYCLPCPEEVEVWKVLLFEAQTKRFPPDMVMKLSEEPMKTAENCVECGECTEKCPYELPIPDMISKSLEQYWNYRELHGL
jgi:predicted aldo/keto reductase-like oxidoreductase